MYIYLSVYVTHTFVYVMHRSTLIYIWRALFQKRVNHHTKIWISNVNTKSADCGFGLFFLKSFSHRYYICVHNAHISEELFSKISSLNMAFALQTQFFYWRLARFGKELFIYNTHAQIYIYVHDYIVAMLWTGTLRLCN